MRILILPNSFKGSLSARQTARVLTQALRHEHNIKSFPLSDGGDGFIDFFQALYPSASLVRLHAKNAFLKKAPTSYLWLPEEKTAVLETARICGLGSAKKEDLDPLGASSFGVGEVMRHALRRGAKTIYVGLGGVACNDGGAGIACALGARFLDMQGKEIPLGAKPLLRLAHVDIKELKKKIQGVKIYAVADVINPLLGPRGSARVFGPQKGATPSQVRMLEKALTVYARAIKKSSGKNTAHRPSAAAAGALCAGLYGLLNARIILGSNFIKKHLPLTQWIKKADLIITSEGRFDEQTGYGKAPLAVLETAATEGKPVLFFCGTYEEKALKKLPKNLCLSIVSLTDFAKNKQDSIKNAATYMRRICKNLSLLQHL